MLAKGIVPARWWASSLLAAVHSASALSRGAGNSLRETMVQLANHG